MKNLHHGGFAPMPRALKLGEVGPFIDFCKNAEIDSENDYFFMSDETNRGNI